MKDCANCDHMPEDCISCETQIHSNMNRKSTLIKIYQDLEGTLTGLDKMKLSYAKARASGVLRGIDKLMEETGDRNNPE